ncbi:hypothetical protein LACPH_002120 [Lacticaseibacillus parahuelsenbergensis]|uniref:Uncharacterized protein n=1 Tax=Lacticaseibacillus parahuelsenbergensis TaxID=3068305 RepID=A0ABY9L0Z0_9LACO|nr:hypothetical protein [Lacticaseibacillus sp. NCIMB 15471]WLV77376.1 hypothetical protein LACPH_002120 [Lacticaseibacillus sp. NCIMB 15471]
MHTSEYATGLRTDSIAYDTNTRAYRIGQAAVDKGKVLDGVGKYLGKGLALAGFGINTTEDILNHHKSLGQAVVYNGVSSGIGYLVGSLAFTGLAAASIPGVIAVGAAAALSVGAAWFYGEAYKNNYFGTRDITRFFGKKFDGLYNGAKNIFNEFRKSGGHITYREESL